MSPQKNMTLTRYAIQAGDISATILNFGGIIQSFEYNGHPLTLSYPNLNDYLDDPFYIGAIAGRYANRIERGFTSDSGWHALACNENDNCLHGGFEGLNKQHWHCIEHTSNSVTLSCTLADGHQGFPGELAVTVRYEIKENASLTIDISATTTKTTPVSITQHSYFNLGEDQQITLEGDAVLVNNQNNLPNGERVSIAQALAWPHDIDNHIITNKHSGLWKMATIQSKAQQLSLQVWSDKPGYQYYQGRYLAEPFKPYQGLCIEPQHVPNGPNQSQFNTGLLQPNQKYRHRIEYRLSKHSLQR
ncbi:aldose epimerase family protein [Paraferrimonas haliotis]|uniref:Aldose 1-epimerase n=1 Tax=Paraferrimonas haliotis TaxID=2013866 RepID=A0AA37TN49_9GAMM|nr:aldose epimerase family protein [Paraferrimonas haliotis]GLS83458.1 aldose 1-epimerase [Paraferrimonas haliotis]